VGKILVAGLVGGLIVFAWGALAHVVLPLGTAGLRTIKGEDPVLSAMRTSMSEPGMYFFPGEGWTADAPEEVQNMRNEKAAKGPAGLIVYQVHEDQRFGPMLGKQFLSDVAAAIVAAFVLWHVAANHGYGRRVLLSCLLGVFAWLTISVPYWNWYKFDPSFTAAALVEDAVGWLIAGLWLAKAARPTA
jgi:hypothetical protein